MLSDRGDNERRSHVCGGRESQSRIPGRAEKAIGIICLSERRAANKGRYDTQGGTLKNTEAGSASGRIAGTSSLGAGVFR